MSSADDSEATIETYQRGKKEFRARWLRNVAFVMLPGFLLGFAGMGRPHFRVLGGIGWAVLGVGVLRYIPLARTYLVCPVCGGRQGPRVCFPFRACVNCGARLSDGVGDS